MQIPSPVRHILSTLESAGYEAFIVGGCVRDILRGIAPKDWDITTNAIPLQVKALFTRTFDTGIKHGTITVLQDRQPFEVTTYRVDGPYTDARRPDTVTYATCIEEDLSRRDFTMNAIAYNPSKGFADPFDGREDIGRKIIRCVGDPAHRFGEDALRMLRAIRFAGTLGFTVDPAALAAITAQSENLARISAERVREELTRLLCGEYPRVIALLDSTGLMPYVLQNRLYAGDLMKTIDWLEGVNKIRLVESQNPPNDVKFNEYTRLVLFFFPFDAVGEIPRILRDLRFDNKTIQAVRLLARLLPVPIPADRYIIKKHLRQMPKAFAQAFFENLLLLKEITNQADPSHLAQLYCISREIHKNNECYTLQNLAVNGKDLAEIGIPPGKIMGDTLESLLDAVMREPGLNKKSRLLRLHRGE
jgi:tRNA nucleotidyltransferase (CCA-adding enzyme)